MGFSKVFLVGCDYTHTNSRIHHWYEYGTGLLYKQEMYNKDFYDIAQKYIDITTITLEGDGLYLKAIEYEKYSKKTNCYLENTKSSVYKEDLKTIYLFLDYKNTNLRQRKSNLKNHFEKAIKL